VKRRRLLALIGAGATFWPIRLRAQQKPIPLVGYLNNERPGANDAAFRQGLGEMGYVEGQNVTIEYRWAETYDQLPALAAELVRRRVDVLVTGNFPATLAAKAATSTIPIIFEVGIDPVERGLVASFARPGGNLTGISSMSIELTPKRVELLTELVPQAGVIALLVNPTNPTTERVLPDVINAATVKGVQLHILKASTEREIDAAFASLAELRASALILPSDPFFNARPELLATIAARYTVPIIYAWRTFVASGGLISYGPSLPDAFRHVGNYVGRILKGVQPADLPVHQSAKIRAGRQSQDRQDAGAYSASAAACQGR
jgi:putative tryptophan/tyrosine transport system substrate-binding protein